MYSFIFKGLCKSEWICPPEWTRRRFQFSAAGSWNDVNSWCLPVYFQYSQGLKYPRLPFSEAPGKIFLLNLKEPDMEPMEMPISGNFDPETFNPHGISVYTEPTSMSSSALKCIRCLFAKAWRQFIWQYNNRWLFYFIFLLLNMQLCWVYGQTYSETVRYWTCQYSDKFYRTNKEHWSVKFNSMWWS